MLYDHSQARQPEIVNGKVKGWRDPEKADDAGRPTESDPGVQPLHGMK